MTDDFLSSLELSVRCSNVLRNNEITTPQLFYNLTQKHFLSFKGAGRRSWTEIAEVQGALRRERRQKTILGKALGLLRDLNDLPLEEQGYFITKNRAGRLRLGRYIAKEDFDELE